ncbi:Rh-like protein/ammonium transporter [Lentithecium fluviatile CBS 122367]|uniref:Rh-like protein/ammonium transporter n=1 Tax=Lentithecium fluviatile CBS 122367 TaxID=1168545 RepID=A0A6G1IDD1_9PLEO|nr:Rh-like protein/ammonium transporter [Lentithecium fluviatile CBS 122367]
MEATQYHFDVVPKRDSDVSATEEQIRQHPPSYYDGADLVWMMICSALVFLMVPGIGLHYSGTSRKANVYMVWQPVITASTVALVWFLWGYAIAFSPSGSGFWGGSTGIVLHGVLVKPVGNARGPKLPELVYALFQGMFACFTASVVSGATIYKQRTFKWLVFTVFWVTLVYCPIAHSSWSPDGWANKAGALDFAGGTPVHITAGTSALAYALFYRLQLHRWNRTERKANRSEKPVANWIQREGREHVPTVVIGTILLWIGWFGFNGGSALGANMRAVSAIFSTNLAACAGGISASLLDDIYSRAKMVEIREERRKSNLPPFTPAELDDFRHKFFKSMILSFCNGAVAGMVTVTPAAGYISPYFAPLFGLFGAISSAYASRLSKYLFDSLDIFAMHTVSGFVGMVLTAFFADAGVVALDGYNSIPGGFINHHFVQVATQLVDAVAAMAYSFSVTFLILCFMHFRTWFKSREPILVLDS